MDQYDEVVQTILSEWAVHFPSMKYRAIYPTGFRAPDIMYLAVTWYEPSASRVQKELMALDAMLKKHQWALLCMQQKGCDVNGCISDVKGEKLYKCSVVVTYVAKEEV